MDVFINSVTALFILQVIPSLVPDLKCVIHVPHQMSIKFNAAVQSVMKSYYIIKEMA